MWPWALHTQKCDVACGEESGDLLETLLGILPLQERSVEVHVNTFEALRAKSLGLCQGPPHLSLFFSLSLSVFPYSSHCLCIDSINSPCLLPTFGWGGKQSWLRCPGEWLPENVVANPPVSCPFGEVKARPPLGLKRDIFRVFCLSLGVSLPLIFP